MESNDLMIKAVSVLDSKKARNIKVLNISPLTTIADYFVVCSGGSTTQIKALSDALDEELEKVGVHFIGKEGFNAANWILMDYGSVVVHIFSEETRDFYSIEHLWADAEEVDISEYIIEEN
ncbi:MAG: ribosome silencing factor [Clostridia bacterium]|nr:ribosome silencing factor [Clostridia bacterium]